MKISGSEGDLVALVPIGAPVHRQRVGVRVEVYDVLEVLKLKYLKDTIKENDHGCDVLGNVYYFTGV